MAKPTKVKLLFLFLSMPIWVFFAKKSLEKAGGGGLTPIATPFHGTKLKLRHIHVLHVREIVIANHYLVELKLSVFTPNQFTKDIKLLFRWLS